MAHEPFRYDSRKHVNRETVVFPLIRYILQGSPLPAVIVISSNGILAADMASTLRDNEGTFFCLCTLYLEKGGGVVHIRACMHTCACTPTWCQLRLWVGGLHRRRHKGNPLAIGRHVVCVAAAEDIHVCAPACLLLRQDDLHAVCIVGIGNGVALQGSTVPTK